MAPSHVFFAPGMFSDPSCFAACANQLQNGGFTTRTGFTRTTGTKSPGNPTIEDNMAQCRKDISSFVEDAGEEQVIVAMHSASGHFCCGSLKDLGAEARNAAGRPGGVAGLIFIAALLSEEGNGKDLTPKATSAEVLQAAGVVSVNDGQIIVNDPQSVLFNDVPHEEAQKWADKIYPEPTAGWEKPMAYMGWRDIPSHYIICEKDRLVPPGVQESLGKLAGSTLVRMNAGHFPQISQPEELARIIGHIAAKW